MPCNCGHCDDEGRQRLAIWVAIAMGLLVAGSILVGWWLAN